MTVKVFSTPTCPWCTAAKQYLASKNVPYQDIDVSKDRAAASEMVSKTGQMGVPVIAINGTYIVGFDRNRIDQLLTKSS